MSWEQLSTDDFILKNKKKKVRNTFMWNISQIESGTCFREKLNVIAPLSLLWVYLATYTPIATQRQNRSIRYLAQSLRKQAFINNWIPSQRFIFRKEPSSFAKLRKYSKLKTQIRSEIFQRYAYAFSSFSGERLTEQL